MNETDDSPLAVNLRTLCEESRIVTGIELADLLSEENELYHFCEQIQQNRLYFDYLVKRGKLETPKRHQAAGIRRLSRKRMR